MKDKRIYFREGISVFKRQGISPLVSTEVARCSSGVMAKLIANCLNLYNRKKLKTEAQASEKGEHHVVQTSDEGSRISQG